LAMEDKLEALRKQNAKLQKEVTLDKVKTTTKKATV